MTKEELHKIIYLDCRIDSKLRQLEGLKNTRGSIKGLDYSKDRIQCERVNSLEETVMKIIETENKINKDIDKLVDMKDNARKEINKIDGVEGMVLEMRYLECMRWEEIAYRLNYSIQHIYRIHGQALMEIKDESKC